MRNKWILPSLILTLTASVIHADKVVTTRKQLKTAKNTSASINRSYAQIDTLTGHTQAVRFCGYEKKLRSSKETIFIENLTDSTIIKTSFHIDYIDNQGRTIHSRSHVLETVEIPPRQTRRFDIPSWDKQNSYYYIKGEHPRKSATPYDIIITTDTLFIQPCIQ